MIKRIVNFHNQKFTITIRDEADNSVANEIFVHQEYRVAQETVINATSCIIDVGAHSGLFTIYARALNPLVSIIALEPEVKNITQFKKHLEVNKIRGVTLIEQALAGSFGKRKLHVSEDSHNHHLLSSKEVDSEAVEVQATTVSAIIKKIQPKKIDLIKLDIEGAEYEVFESMMDEDFAMVEAVIMEYHNLPGKNYKSIEKILREHGFGVQIFPSKFDTTMGFLWARNKRRQ